MNNSMTGAEQSTSNPTSNGRVAETTGEKAGAGGAPYPPVGRLAIFVRAVKMVGTMTVYGGPAVLETLFVRLTGGRQAARQRAFKRLRRLIERLGPTYVKFGQMMSGRRDALPEELCDQLALLHDKVHPMRQRQAKAALKEAYGDGYPDLFSQLDLTPTASGSIACVYRAVLPSGETVALKLRRPKVVKRMRADLGLLRGAARLAERSKKVQGMPIGDLVEFMCTAIEGQLDFAREARNLERMRTCVSELERVKVPGQYPELNRPNCLVMEFIEELDVANIGRHPMPVRADLATRVLETVHTMLFDHGFVHCDLHAGNLYLDRHHPEVVLLDAGYVAEAPDEVRSLMGEFFMRMAMGHGLRCGQIVLESAAEVGPEVDADRFTGAVALLVNAKAGPANPDFTMMSFGNDLFDLQRDYGIYARSAFAFPLMSLGTLEATVHQIDPDVDFQKVGTVNGQGPSKATTKTGEATP